MKKYSFFFFLLFSQLAFSQKPMLCARIEGLWHFYDTNGKEMFEANTARAAQPQGWVNGMLAALQITGATLDSSQSILPIFKPVLLDVKGNLVLEPKIKDAYRIISPIDAVGYALLTNQETGNFMICDKKGEVVPFPANATNATYRGEGIIEFIAREDSIEDSSNAIKTLYDLKQKKVIHKGKWLEMGSFNQGICFFNTLEKTGVINKKGEIIIKADYHLPVDSEDEIYTFMYKTTHDYIILKDETDNYLIFNKLGKQIGSNSFAEMPIAKRNYISIHDEENGEYLIDEKGKIIVNFDKAYVHKVCAQNSIFLSKDEQKWDIFNAKGKKINTISAEKIEPFQQNHYTSFSIGERNGIMSEEGKVIVPLGNYSFSIVCDDFFESKQEENDDIKYQFWNLDGKMVLKNPIQEMGADWIIPVNPTLKCYVPQ